MKIKDQRRKMNRKDSIYHRFVELILTRSDDELGDLTVERVISTLNISKSQMYDKFKTQNRFSPAGFLVLIKIFRSALMLEENDVISIKNVSKKMGFSSSDYFTKVFREYFGTTPGRYRTYLKKRTKNQNH